MNGTPRRADSSTKAERLQELLGGLVAASPAGAQLPSERELAVEHGIARMTARQAVDGLVAKGLVYRVQGQGTFVAEPRLVQAERLTSFSEDMAARGLVASAIVLAQEVVPATEAVARRLEVAAGSPVVRVERIRSGDGRPVALERVQLPEARFPGLADVDLADASLYAVLAEHYGVEVDVADQRVAVVRLTPGEAHVLEASPDVPSFLIERVTRDAAGTVLEYVRSLYRGDRYELHTRLQRTGGAPGAATVRSG